MAERRKFLAQPVSTEREGSTGTDTRSQPDAAGLLPPSENGKKEANADVVLRSVSGAHEATEDDGTKRFSLTAQVDEEEAKVEESDSRAVLASNLPSEDDIARVFAGVDPEFLNEELGTKERLQVFSSTYRDVWKISIP